MLIPQKRNERFPQYVVLKALSYLCVYARGGLPSALCCLLNFVGWIPCVILMFLDCLMVVKNKSLLTAAVQTVVDCQDPSSHHQAMAYGSEETKSFALGKTHEWSMWYEKPCELSVPGNTFPPKFTQSTHTSQRDLLFPTHWALQGFQRVDELWG